jgi:iron complex outermembrane receptor protein
MRYQLIIPALILSSLLNIAGAQGILAGRVFDKATLEPLNGVYVIYNKNQGTTTDANGDYLIRSPEGTIEVTFQFIGYKPFSKSVSVAPGDTVRMDVWLETAMKEIGQIVVSASKYEQKVSELSVSMDVLKSSDFLKTHITDTKELITKSPGIEVMDGQASIRGGTGFSYGLGSRVMALIDGLPVLSPDAGSIKWQFLPLENISQVEIIKGASSVMYGSSALNGVINFRTADAGMKPETSFFAETGVYGKPQNRNWIWWNSPRTFSNISFSHLQKYGKNDIGIGINFLDNNSYRKYNDETLGRLSLKLKHRNGKVNGLTYGLNINSGYTDKTDFVLWENAQTGALKQDTSSVSALHGSFVAVDPFVSFSNDGPLRHDLRMRFQSANNHFPVRSENNSDALSVYGEYQVSYKLARIFNLTGGIVENYNKVISNFYGDHQIMNLAGYSQLEANPVKRVRLVAGIRIEHNAMDGISDRTVPIFRTGINWQAAEYTFLRGSFGQGYRYPSIAEKFASTTLGSVRIIPNPDILPESGWSSEIGVKQGLKTGGFEGLADFSVFLSQNKDLIEFQLTNYPYFGFRATNVEQSRIYGYELEFSLENKSGILPVRFGGGYTYIHPVELNAMTGKETGEFLKYRRKHSLKLSAGTSFRKLEAGIDVWYRSKILRIDNVFLLEITRESILPGFYDYWNSHNTGYFLADASLAYNFTQNLSFSFAVKNLTNTEYMGRPGDIQPQRNFSFRISGKF